MNFVFLFQYNKTTASAKEINFFLLNNSDKNKQKAFNYKPKIN